MSFLNLPGLWLLLGIPALIIIYLIKAQHEDHPLSSTYIWRLSSRFMKKRLPMQKVKKILAFLMQLVILLGAAFLASRPAVINGKSCDYIAIIDASASMQTTDEKGISRFDRALEEVEQLSEEIGRGHRVSVILAADNASWLVQNSTSQNEVKLALKNAICTNGGCDTTDAITMAQELCQKSNNPKVLFFTDNDYTETENIQVINLNTLEWNVAVSNIRATAERTGTTFSGTLVSYNQSATVTVGLRINGVVKDAQRVECAANLPVQVSFFADNVTAYDTAEIFVETADGLLTDNSYAICRQIQRTYQVMLVSKSPLYLESALKALGNCSVTVAASPEEAAMEGFDLYIFDGLYPEEYPTDGSVLLFGNRQLPDGLSAGTLVEDAAALTTDSDKTSDLYEDLALKDTVVTNYTPLKGNSLWKALFYCGDSPVLTTRQMGNGLQFTVVSFDLHDSNLPMQTDFVIFMRNLVEYSAPALLKETDHVAGSTVTLTVLASAQQLYVELPDNSIKAMSTAANTCSIPARDVGIYTAVMTTAEGGEYVDFFIHIPYGESASVTISDLSVDLSVTAGGEIEDAISEIWFWLALGMLVIVLAEWGWYYHEQY